MTRELAVDSVAGPGPGRRLSPSWPSSGRPRRPAPCSAWWRSVTDDAAPPAAPARRSRRRRRRRSATAWRRASGRCPSTTSPACSAEARRWACARSAARSPIQVGVSLTNLERSRCASALALQAARRPQRSIAAGRLRGRRGPAARPHRFTLRYAVPGRACSRRCMIRDPGNDAPATCRSAGRELYGSTSPHPRPAKGLRHARRTSQEHDLRHPRSPPPGGSRAALARGAGRRRRAPGSPAGATPARRRALRPLAGRRRGRRAARPCALAARAADALVRAEAAPPAARPRGADVGRRPRGRRRGRHRRRRDRHRRPGRVLLVRPPALTGAARPRPPLALSLGARRAAPRGRRPAPARGRPAAASCRPARSARSPSSASARAAPAAAAPEPFRLTISEGDRTMVDGTPVFFRGFRPDREQRRPPGHPGPRDRQHRARASTGREVFEGEHGARASSPTTRRATTRSSSSAPAARSRPTRSSARSTIPAERDARDHVHRAAGRHVHLPRRRPQQPPARHGTASMVVLPQGVGGAAAALRARARPADASPPSCAASGSGRCTTSTRSSASSRARTARASKLDFPLDQARCRATS